CNHRLHPQAEELTRCALATAEVFNKIRGDGDIDLFAVAFYGVRTVSAEQCLRVKNILQVLEFAPVDPHNLVAGFQANAFADRSDEETSCIIDLVFLDVSITEEKC